MDYLERRADFEREPARAEVLPLQAALRALHRWDLARTEANELARAAREAPADERLARCAAQAGADVAALAGVAARAVRAWHGAADGPLFVHDADDEPGHLRVDAGGLWVIQPADPGFPAADEVVDLLAVARDQMRRSVAAVVADPDHRRRAIKQVDRDRRNDPINHALGSGHTVWSLAWLAAAHPAREA